MNACSERCGHCGRCDDGPRPVAPTRPARLTRMGDPRCIVCDGPTDGTRTIAGYGHVCSGQCRDAFFEGAPIRQELTCTR